MSAAEKVRDFIKNRPYIAEALEKNIVNISELSRIVQEELKIDNVHAVIAAIRRYTVKLKKHKHKREEAVLKLLELSKLVLLDNLSIIITKKNFNIPNKMKIKLTDLHYVYLVENSILKKTQQKLVNEYHHTHVNCTALIIHSPKQMETTPGVVPYLTSLLSSQNVYALAFASCYTETTIIVERKDASKGYEILSKVIG